MCLFLYYDRWQEGTRYHDTGASWRKQEKKQKKDVKREKSPQLFNVARLTPLSRGTLVSAGTSVTAEWWLIIFCRPTCHVL